MRMLVCAALLAALVAPAIAGGDKAGGTIGGYACDNMCPLATEANLHRSYGLESRSTSTVARADVAAMVERNLSRV